MHNIKYKTLYFDNTFRKNLFHLIMKITLAHKIKQLVASLVIIAMGLLVVNNVVFLHAHKLTNGKIVVHAHPYNKGQDSAPFKKHNHSSKELALISHLQLLFFAALLLTVSLFRSEITSVFFFQKHVYRSGFKHSIKGRAPPYSLF
ncbi:hypothetical protein DET65_1367 [Sunxiuqinia elliptica]|uniref:Uncharacterized protein n=2 Tax=Sunxiuqinia elliptica TaxID=655355 RepID=A0A4R6HBV2_9BACT|nr:hypothetical protein DET52_101808 [Sunxiuqinia elliptica]TDO64994.1 hypothetical protein DET65_1367 [Sunxiuqinia elliptica]